MGDRCLKAIAGVLQKIQIPGQVFAPDTVAMNL